MIGLLPVELIREIIGHVFVFQPVTATDERGANRKPKWDLISSLSVASRTYRTLALEAWFRVLFTKSPVDLVFLQYHLQDVHEWTREMHCVSTGQPLPSLWDLVNFCRLQTIRLDCPSIRYHKFPFVNVPSSVTDLELRGMNWPSPYVFHAVTETFPQLQSLRLSQPKTWCGLCHTCSKVKFAGVVPPKLVYGDGLGLPIHYARALSPLQHLRSVSIAVPYSRGIHIHLDPSDPGRDLWSGECDRCVGIMYEDDTFRERWIARKRGTLLPDSRGVDSLDRLYLKPPALEAVEWTFWHDEGDENDDQEYEEDEDEEEEQGDEEEEGEGDDNNHDNGQHPSTDQDPSDSLEEE
ncbi:hypothetical protein C8R45DRAFT_478145 [Mycena sanguinolenta]|nr:hypothetical protein C8R45DRAFT_478145 [Mycena sanguinolenta]